VIAVSAVLGDIQFTSIDLVSNGIEIVVAFDSQVTNLDLFSCSDIPVWNWGHLLTTNLTGSSNGTLSWVDTDPSATDACFFVGADADVDTDAEGVRDGYEIYIYNTDPNDPDSDDDAIDDYHDPEPAMSNDFVKLWRVSFSGPENHVVQSDSQTTNFSSPQYLDTNLDGDAGDPGDQSHPICYTRDGILRVEAEFKIDPVPSGVVFSVRGDGPGGVDIPATIATLEGDILTLPATDATNSFANEVDLMNPMAIDWSVSYDFGTNWNDAGISSNLLYVTWDDPVQTNPIQTFLHVGCESADGESGTVGTNDDEILDKLWAALQTKDIGRASDGFPLSYYGFYDVNSNETWDAGIDVDMNSTSNCTPTSAEALITNANGQCHSWITFMNEVMEAQGLATVNGVTNKRVALVMKGGNPGFGVSSWAKEGTNAFYWIVNFDAGIDGSNPTDPGPDQAADAVGVSGQGNSPNAPSSFQNHWLVKMNNEYYDPCYAIGPYTDLKDYEDAAFDGWIGGGFEPAYPLIDLPANDGNPTNHDDEVNDYTEIPYD